MYIQSCTKPIHVIKLCSDMFVINRLYDSADNPTLHDEGRRFSALGRGF